MKGEANMTKYITPEMEITEFDVEDIITTSSGDPAGNDEGQGEVGQF